MDATLEAFLDRIAPEVRRRDPRLLGEPNPG
jgi:hypothetical protein